MKFAHLKSISGPQESPLGGQLIRQILISTLTWCTQIEKKSEYCGTENINCNVVHAKGKATTYSRLHINNSITMTFFTIECWIYAHKMNRWIKMQP